MCPTVESVTALDPRISQAEEAPTVEDVLGRLDMGDDMHIALFIGALGATLDIELGTVMATKLIAKAVESATEICQELAPEREIRNA